MIEIEQFIKKSNYILIFFYWFVFSKNGFAPQYWQRDLIAVDFISKKNLILITTAVYDYSSGPNSLQGRLEYCKFEASEDNRNYIILMEAEILKQRKYINTKVTFKNKKENAMIVFLETLHSSKAGFIWSESLKSRIDVKVPNSENTCAATFKWCLGSDFKDVRYIRVSGLWTVNDMFVDFFKNVVYDLTNPNQKAIKTNIPEITTNETKKDQVYVLKVSESIDIKGVDLDSNINVHSTTGLKIKSVISVKNVVKIIPPPKQTYIVHIGKSRYKVAL